MANIWMISVTARMPKNVSAATVNRAKKLVEKYLNILDERIDYEITPYKGAKYFDASFQSNWNAEPEKFAKSMSKLGFGGDTQSFVSYSDIDDVDDNGEPETNIIYIRNTLSKIQKKKVKKSSESAGLF